MDTPLTPSRGVDRYRWFSDDGTVGPTMSIMTKYDVESTDRASFDDEYLIALDYCIFYTIVIIFIAFSFTWPTQAEQVFFFLLCYF